MVKSFNSYISARHRNRHSMLPMTAFGMTAAGLVMAPMAFQFLAVLAGKALLLSKMALLLATVNGLKKVLFRSKILWLIGKSSLTAFHYITGSFVWRPLRPVSLQFASCSPSLGQRRQCTSKIAIVIR